MPALNLLRELARSDSDGGSEDAIEVVRLRLRLEDEAVERGGGSMDMFDNYGIVEVLVTSQRNGDNMEMMVGTGNRSDS